MNDDLLIWESYYNCILLEADAASNIAGVVNSYVTSKVGHSIRNKNKPENRDIIEKYKKEIEPVIEKIKNWILENDKSDKNLNNLQHLFRFYMQLENNPDRDSLLQKDYIDYLKIPSLTQKNTLHKTTEYKKWAEEVHANDVSEANTSSSSASSDDENKVYEDDQVIVFLANNVNDPRKSVNNCIKYGRGSTLCISSSNARGSYHSYRWNSKLTTYFCWLKNKQRYMLVDAKENNTGYSYNPIFQENKGKLIQNNVDTPASSQTIISKFPELQKAFDNQVFKSVPIEGRELEFYEKFYNSESISDFNNQQDRINYASLKDLTQSDWGFVESLGEKDIKEILTISIETTETDIPEYILTKFPSLEKRYWVVVTNRLERELDDWDPDEDEAKFTDDELIVMSNNQNILNKAIEKIPNIGREYLIHKEFMDIYGNSQTIGDFEYESIFPLSLPQLEKVSGDIDANKATTINLPQLKVSGYIYARSATTINLPQLEKVSGYIDAPNATTINLPQLKESGYIDARKATTINLPQLEKVSGHIYANNTTTIDLPQLKESGHIYANNATTINLPQLKESGHIYANNATTINLPQLEKESGHIYANNATTINLPQLKVSGDIDANNATTINLPQLEKVSGHIYANKATTIDLPQLKESGQIDANNTTTIDLPQLKVSGHIYANKATTIDLPQLKVSGYIDANNATTINLPQLKVNGDIDARSAKKITIRSSLRSKLKKVPEDCVIEEPKETQINDSVVYNLMRKFLLTS